MIARELEERLLPVAAWEDHRLGADIADEGEFARREFARREMAKRSYKYYLYYVHGTSWLPTRMSDFLADTVQGFVEEETGNAYDILLIETPPQHGKSMSVTEAYPSWHLGKHDHHRVIEASYNEETGKRFGRRNQEKIQEFGGALFGIGRGEGQGHIWTTTDFELSNGWGRMLSRGMMSGITGNPANLMIIDDPIKNRAEADSQTQRDRVWAEWQNTLKSRLAAGAKVIVIMTPWHEDDFAARLLRNEGKYTRLVRLPIEAEDNDPLGRAPGEPLCPELGKDQAWLKTFKEGYLNDPRNGGMRAWTALYQCSPRVEGGNIIQRDWWQFYDATDREFLDGWGTTCISVDAAFKGNEDNDYVAIQVWSKRGSDYYLRYSLNKHLDFPGTVAAILATRALYPETMYILIEDKANGSAIIQTLQKELVGVIGITPSGGKVARVNAVAPAIESRKVFLPEDKTGQHAAWVEEFIDQFTAFPAGAHDDMVDACSQCLNWLLYMNGSPRRQMREDERRRIAEEAQAREELTDNDRLYGLYGLYGTVETSGDVFRRDRDRELARLMGMEINLYGGW